MSALNELLSKLEDLYAEGNCVPITLPKSKVIGSIHASGMRWPISEWRGLRLAWCRQSGVETCVRITEDAWKELQALATIEEPQAMSSMRDIRLRDLNPGETLHTYTQAEVFQILRNVGVDVECCACMAVAMTGAAPGVEHTCDTTCGACKGIGIK